MDDSLIRTMSYKLKKRFYIKFWTDLIILFSISIMVLIISIVTLFNFLKGIEDIKVVIICFCILIVMIVGTIIDMKPFFRDIKNLKMEKFEKITGKIVKYRKVVHAGDPSTESYYPTIRDIDADWIEIEVKADGTELNKTYHCIYLSNTKIAICDELQNFK